MESSIRCSCCGLASLLRCPDRANCPCTRAGGGSSRASGLSFRFWLQYKPQATQAGQWSACPLIGRGEGKAGRVSWVAVTRFVCGVPAAAHCEPPASRGPAGHGQGVGHPPAETTGRSKHDTACLILLDPSCLPAVFLRCLDDAWCLRANPQSKSAWTDLTDRLIDGSMNNDDHQSIEIDRPSRLNDLESRRCAMLAKIPRVKARVSIRARAFDP